MFWQVTGSDCITSKRNIYSVQLMSATSSVLLKLVSFKYLPDEISNSFSHLVPWLITPVTLNLDETSQLIYRVFFFSYFFSSLASFIKILSVLTIHRGAGIPSIFSFAASLPQTCIRHLQCVRSETFLRVKDIVTESLGNCVCACMCVCVHARM